MRIQGRRGVYQRLVADLTDAKFIAYLLDADRQRLASVGSEKLFQLTGRYRFDDEGVSMSFGVIFRREMQLTYARMQDIHLSQNIVERWLGIRLCLSRYRQPSESM